ncbi:hypothetical protein [Streptomyces sp. ODS05-4]|uniref:hypothetical protein n=1 Tax=Streptomyces sp. ODS05-4 TaxID=2944939 RepID=UPI00210DCA13|nr:hypothetical protein [Streptomyces sp. ODS05-4]
MQYIQTDRGEREIVLRHETLEATPIALGRWARRAWNHLVFIFSHTDPHDVRFTR